MFVFIHLLGREEMILSLAQYLAKFLVDPYKLFPNICHVRWSGKNRPNSFFYWKICHLSSKECVFNNLLGPKELILLLPQ